MSFSTLVEQYRYSAIFYFNIITATCDILDHFTHYLFIFNFFPTKLSEKYGQLTALSLNKAKIFILCLKIVFFVDYS